MRGFAPEHAPDTQALAGREAAAVTPNPTNRDAASILQDRIVANETEVRFDPYKYLDPAFLTKKDLPHLHVRLEQLERHIRGEGHASSAAFGELAGLIAERQMVKNAILALETGKGIYQGTKAIISTSDTSPAPLPAGVAATDCITFVLETLGSAFAMLGRSDEWNQIHAYALQLSQRYNPGKGMIGLMLQRAFQERLGWKAVYFSSDEKTTDQDYAQITQGVKDTGLYTGLTKHVRMPGLRVDRSKLVLNYRPDVGNGSKTQKNETPLERLRNVPFGILAARGGDHMACISYGKVIEAHWADDASSPNTIQAHDLSTWAWNSGLICAPSGDLERAWRRPLRQAEAPAEDASIDAYAKDVNAKVDELIAFVPTFTSYFLGDIAPDDRLRRFRALIVEIHDLPDLRATLQQFPSSDTIDVLINWHTWCATFWSAHAERFRTAYATVKRPCPEFACLDRKQFMAEKAAFGTAAMDFGTDVYVSSVFMLLQAMEQGTMIPA